jgi:MFS family permease
MDKDLQPAPPVFRGISPRLKRAVFAIEALNGLATTFYFYYLYFYTQERFNFGAMQNLLLAALLGAVYAGGSYGGGRFAQKFGYLTSIRLGIVLMMGGLLACSQAAALWLTILLSVVTCVGMCLTWPALEALLTEGEPPARLPGLVGAYNCVWAGVAGVAYFFGGTLLEKWGWPTLFYLPAGLMVLELWLAVWLAAEARRQTAAPEEAVPPLLRPLSESYRSSVPPATFLKMAWVANPMAYLAINTIISSTPTLARRLHFSPMLAGFVCSLWLFARAGAFVALWQWPGWHYRFRFLASAYVVMMASFAAMLLVPSVWVLVVSQLLLGPALGLIYYSSLFYAMDVGTTKGEHGGIHEAVIGLGNTTGPAVAAAALKFLPGTPGIGVWAVCLLLTPGLVVLYWARYKEQSAPG